MKKYNQVIEAYEFSELSEDAKNKAKDLYIECCREPSMFSEEIKTYLEAVYGLSNLVARYSLSYSQGDGLCLEGKIDDSEIFSNPLFRKIALKGLIGRQIPLAEDAISSVSFIHNGRYYHSKSVDIDICDNHYNMTEKQIDVVNKVLENITSWYFEFCDEWEKYGYDFFYKVSNEEMQEFCDSNDWMFDINGVVLNTSGLEEVA